jgi:hypothetical protein
MLAKVMSEDWSGRTVERFLEEIRFGLGFMRHCISCLCICEKRRRKKYFGKSVCQSRVHNYISTSQSPKVLRPLSESVDTAFVTRRIKILGQRSSWKDYGAGIS